MKHATALVLFLAHAIPASGTGQGPSKKYGQAIALNKREWKMWTEFILNTHGARLFVLVSLTAMFA